MNALAREPMKRFQPKLTKTLHIVCPRTNKILRSNFKVTKTFSKMHFY